MGTQHLGGLQLCVTVVCVEILRVLWDCYVLVCCRMLLARSDRVAQLQEQVQLPAQTHAPAQSESRNLRLLHCCPSSSCQHCGGTIIGTALLLVACVLLC